MNVIRCLFFALLFGWPTLQAQTQVREPYNQAIQNLEADRISKAQSYLDQAKEAHSTDRVDTTACAIHNLQSELFYYMGLFQFGAHEAEKSIDKSLHLKDSILIATAYFFQGINRFELQNFQSCENALVQSLRFYPQKKVHPNRMGNSVLKEYILNNLAQTKLKLNQAESALAINRQAYELAFQNGSKRAISNSEQTFGEIYKVKGQLDSSRYYFEKSIHSAMSNFYYDVALVGHAYLTLLSRNAESAIKNYNQGISLITRYPINDFYTRYFYTLVLQSFKKFELHEYIILTQEKIIVLDDKARLFANSSIQEISEQYLDKEKKLFKAETEKLRRQRNITLLLVFSALLCVLVMTLAIVMIKRRNKAEKQQELIRFESLLSGQENERKRIAEELHDGLMGDLSAIKHHLSRLKEKESDTEKSIPLQKTMEMVDQVCAQTREISHNLMPASIAEFGWIEALRQYCYKLNDSQPISIDFQPYGQPTILPQKAETTLYRIVQELINNGIKHSEAHSILVQINSHENEICITVEDDGKGFDPAKVPSGLGLKNIRSRLHVLSAEMEIQSSQSGSFFQIIVDINRLKT